MSVIKSRSSINDFQVGQIVEYNGNRGTCLHAKKGAKAIVISVKELPTYLDIKWEKGVGQTDGGYYPHSFNIVSVAPKNKLDFLLKNRLISNLEYLEALNEK